MTLTPLNSDIIVRRTDAPEETPTIHLLGMREKEYAVAWFEVMAIGPNVVDIVVGNKVLIKYGDYIQPFIHDGALLTMTDESKVQMVLS